MHVTGDDFPLGNLKLVPKGEKDEVFGMPILKHLITEAIQQSPYYQLAHTKQEKPVKDKTSKPFPIKKIHKGKMSKIHKEKSSFKMVDEEEEKTTRKLPVVEGKGKGIATDQQAAKSLLELYKPKKQREDATNTVTLEERTIELDEGQAGSNTEQSHVALAGPNSEPMHDDFLTTIYPKETELESMVTIPIQQASSSIPLLSTLVIDLSPPKPVSPPFQEPIIVNFHHQHPYYNRATQILKWSDDF
ncbi:hypothetical protein Tco_0831587 [Tanacetum coccineum]